MTRALWVALALMASGCVELGDEEPFTGFPEPEGPTGSFEAAQAVFTQRCALSGCHGGTAPANPPALDADQSHRATVGVTGRTGLCRGEILVDPGNPEGSCLLQAIVDGEMPPGGGLPASQIEAVRAWIVAGAPEPATTP